MDTYMQNPERDIQTVARAATTATTVVGGAVGAIAYYLQTRMDRDMSTKQLAKELKGGSEPRILFAASSADAKKFKNFLDQTPIVYTTARIDRGKGSEIGFIYSSNSEQTMNQLREMYLAKERQVFQVGRNTIAQFSHGHSPMKFEGLNYAEMSAMKERATFNRLMFHVAKNENGYSFEFRPDDRTKMNILHSGMTMESEKEGKEIYEKVNRERSELEGLALNVLSKKNEDAFLIGNTYQAIYVDADGYTYEKNGTHKVFVSQNDIDYERKLFQHLQEIKNPQVIQGTQAKNLGFDMHNPSRQKTLSVKEAMESLQIKYLSDVKKLENIPIEKEEAFHRAQRAAELDELAKKKALDDFSHIAVKQDQPLMVGDKEHAIYIDSKGYMFEKSGQKTEFVSRNDHEFEKKFRQHMEEIKRPRLVHGDKAKELAKDMQKKKTLSSKQAMKVLGIKDEKDIEKIKDVPSEQKEALYRLKRSVDLYHTSQEGINHMLESEQKAFDAGHQTRMEFELCLNYADNTSTMAQQYLEDSMSKDDMKLFSTERVSDIRKNMDWREPYDMPDYIDQNNDNILDDIQPELDREGRQDDDHDDR